MARKNIFAFLQRGVTLFSSLKKRDQLSHLNDGHAMIQGDKFKVDQHCPSLKSYLHFTFKIDKPIFNLK